MLDFGYYNVDCMEGMKEFPDGFFDLAIVDPPYGIEKGFSTLSRISKYGRMDIVNDARPNQEYFNELFRVSKNQIVWGFNHLSDLLPTTKEFIFWYKHNPVDSYSDGELAWTSFTKTAKCFDYPYWGGYNADKYRIHPTQKPVALYKWILDNYAKPGDKILDTHVGSASSLIACEDFGFQYVGFEIDKEYYDKGVKRLEQNRAQITINDLLGDWRFP
jgi:site-specific DNA-methyltransferase (adenine-specific)